MQFSLTNNLLLLAGLLAGPATAQPPPSDNAANPLQPTNLLTSGITPLLPSVIGVTPSPSVTPTPTAGDTLPPPNGGGDDGDSDDIDGTDESTDGAFLPTAVPVAMLVPAVGAVVAMLL